MANQNQWAQGKGCQQPAVSFGLDNEDEVNFDEAGTTTTIALPP